MTRRRSGFEHGGDLTRFAWVVEIACAAIFLGIIVGAARLIAFVAELLTPMVTP